MQSKKTNVRNGKVEFWRFIFSIIIVLHHSRYLLGDDRCMFLGGSFAVEFFFLVSGYLMMASIEKRRDAPTELGRETAAYIGRKVKGLCPELFVAYFVALVFVSIVKGNTLLQSALLFINTFFEVTLVKMSGLPSNSLNGVTWYISSMLLCMTILYPLIRKFPDMMVRVVVPLIALLLLGYLGGNFDSPRTPREWIGLTFKGNVRAMAELCLGVICHQAAKKLSALSLSKAGKWLVSITEWLLYLAVIAYMYFETASKYDYFFLLLMMFGIILSFSHQGIDAPLFDNVLCGFLGKASMYLFLCHTFLAQNLNRLLPEDLADMPRMAVYLACAVAAATFVKLFSDLLRKLGPKAGSLAKRIFLAEV